MEQYLIRSIAMRKVEPRELQDVLLHLKKENGDQVWLLGTKGSKRMVEDVNQYNLEQWKRAAELGLVYVLWAEGWGFAPELDATTHLPVLLESYADAFRKVQEPKAAKPAPAPAPAQPTLLEQPAEQATTQPS